MFRPCNHGGMGFSVTPYAFCFRLRSLASALYVSHKSPECCVARRQPQSWQQSGKMLLPDCNRCMLLLDTSFCLQVVSFSSLWTAARGGGPWIGMPRTSWNHFSTTCLSGASVPLRCCTTPGCIQYKASHYPRSLSTLHWCPQCPPTSQAAFSGGVTLWACLSPWSHVEPTWVVPCIALCSCRTRMTTQRHAAYSFWPPAKSVHACRAIL